MTSKRHEEIIAEAKSRFRIASDYFSSNRAAAYEDLEFRAGQQWKPDLVSERERENRPCLTVNRLPQFIRQVTNDARQSRPAIVVSPVDDKGDTKTAKIYQGLIRHIEYVSDADIAYDTAFEGAVTHGRGYVRVITQYENPLSFDQEIRIKRVRNPFMIYMDPTCQAADGSDAEWGIVADYLTREEFERTYPKSKLTESGDWGDSGIGDVEPEWADGDGIRIIEYFYKEYVNTTIYMLSDGTIVDKGVMKGGVSKLLEEGGLKVVQERETTIPMVKWCKLTAYEVLDETDWPGQYIPIIPVTGDELDINGKVIYEGIVRHAKDPQRMLNYWVSSETETIALAPRAPFVAADGQIEPYKDQWEKSATKSQAVLRYKPVSIGGTVLPPPQRNTVEPPIMAITSARMQTSDDLKSTTGIYDASLGARGNEVSGTAIMRRNMQSQVSNFHFIDNLSRSIRHLGRIIVDLIPKVYDTTRTLRIIGDDGKEQMVTVNQLFAGGPRLDIGKYDVTVSAGPSFQSKRQEALAAMLELIKANPGFLSAIGDLMVRNMDWPGSDKLAERLEAMLPPELRSASGDEYDEVPIPIKMQIAQQNQVIEQLTKALNDERDAAEVKGLELESKERIASMQTITDTLKEYTKVDPVRAGQMANMVLRLATNRLAKLNIGQSLQEEVNQIVPDPDQIVMDQLLGRGVPGPLPGQIPGPPPPSAGIGQIPEPPGPGEAGGPQTGTIVNNMAENAGLFPEE